MRYDYYYLPSFHCSSSKRSRMDDDDNDPIDGRRKKFLERNRYFIIFKEICILSYLKKSKYFIIFKEISILLHLKK